MTKCGTDLRYALTVTELSRQFNRGTRDTDAAKKVVGLLHAWESKDSSLYTNALVYSPPSASHASPWPGLVGMTSGSMTLVAGPASAGPDF